MDIGILIGGVITAIVVCISGILIIYSAYISQTKGAVNRLNDEIAKANARQVELNQKIKQADEELEKRRAEAKQLVEKMRSEVEEELKQEREKMITKARQEAEEILIKANNAREKIKNDLEKEFDLRVIEYSVKVLTSVLSEKAKGAFDQTLAQEFLANLESVDMSRITADVTTAEVIAVNALDADFKAKIGNVLKSKLNRAVTVSATTDPLLGGGFVLKFGSMALDGSLRSAMRERGIKMQQQVMDR
jgi:F0F1-type ATP synthase membrane subunit b/b'